MNNSCVCPKGFEGDFCQNETCEDLDGCNSQGSCKNKTCHCFSVKKNKKNRNKIRIIFFFFEGMDWRNMFSQRMPQ